MNINYGLLPPIEAPAARRRRQAPAAQGTRPGQEAAGGRAGAGGPGGVGCQAPYPSPLGEGTGRAAITGGESSRSCATESRPTLPHPSRLRVATLPESGRDDFAGRGAGGGAIGPIVPRHGSSSVRRLPGSRARERLAGLFAPGRSPTGRQGPLAPVRLFGAIAGLAIDRGVPILASSCFGPGQGLARLSPCAGISGSSGGSYAMTWSGRHRPEHAFRRPSRIRRFGRSSDASPASTRAGPRALPRTQILPRATAMVRRRRRAKSLLAGRPASAAWATAGRPRR